MSIEARFEQMEKQMRRMKSTALAMLAAGLLIGLTSGLLLGGNKAKADCVEVRAQRFILVDEQGNERGRWNLIKDEPLLQMSGTIRNPAMGAPLAMLGIQSYNEHGAYVELQAARGASRASMVAENGSTRATVHTVDRGHYVQLSTGHDQTPEMSIFYNSHVQARCAAYGNKTEVEVRTTDQNIKTLSAP